MAAAEPNGENCDGLSMTFNSCDDDALEALLFSSQQTQEPEKTTSLKATELSSDPLTDIPPFPTCWKKGLCSKVKGNTIPDGNKFAKAIMFTIFMTEEYVHVWKDHYNRYLMPSSAHYLKDYWQKFFPFQDHVCKIKEYEICGESCPTTNRHHIQGVLLLTDKTRLSTIFCQFKKLLGVDTIHIKEVYDIQNALNYHRQGKDGKDKEGSHKNIYGNLTDESVSALQDCPVYKGKMACDETKRKKHDEAKLIALQHKQKRFRAAIDDAPSFDSLVEFGAKYPDIPYPDRNEIWKSRIVQPLARIEEGDLRPWQKDIKDEIEHRRKLMESASLDADCRKLTWVSDPQGGAGKSELASFLEADYAQKGIPTAVLTLRNKDTDWEFLSTRGQPKVLIINIPRSIDTQWIPYYVFENLLDGRVISAKYQGSVSPGRTAVLVLANISPDKSQLTSDRWSIKELSKETPIANLDAQMGK